MSEPNDKNLNDNYDALLEKFSFSGKREPKKPAIEEDVKNSGEIYFSANQNTVNEPTVNNYSHGSRDSVQKSSDSVAPRQHILIPEEPEPLKKPVQRPMQTRPAEHKKPTAKKENKATDKANNIINKVSSKGSAVLVIVVVAFVLIASFIIRIPLTGCMNDVLAINRDSTQIRVIIDDKMTTKQIIDLLGKKDLIYSAAFCKLASGFLGYDNDIEYPAGTYFLSSDMGVEGMLNEIIAAGSKESTVSITFPEGYTINQIAERLSSNGVCSTTDFYAALKSDNFYTDYSFLQDLANKDNRYRALEGYLYPDTYEFYVGENANSVVKRFLDNFASKWDDMYAERCKKTEWTVDEILTVASILEKEAFDAEQMPLIASIIYNRLQSSSFPYINCDSTAKYIEAYKEDMQANGTYDALIKSYDTYQKTGLPIGPICNPGSDAIDAALSPDSSDYYYFLHDKAGKLYTARTQAEHEANGVHMNDE